MKIQVLGCSGSIGRDNRTTSFLLDHDILIDAGTGVGDLTLDALEKIDHILLTHSHLDHVLSVPLLADSVMRRRQARRAAPIQVHALPETLEVLREDLLNNRLWPDFTRLPTPERPALQLVPVQVGQQLQLAGRHIEVLPALHAVPACGFAVHAASPGRGAWVYTGDTGPNPALWERLAQFPVEHLIIETAFSEAERHVAAESGHHCPGTLAEELRLAPPGASVHITHIKPGEIDAVMQALRALPTGRAVMELMRGDVFELDGART